MVYSSSMIKTRLLAKKNIGKVHTLIGNTSYRQKIYNRLDRKCIVGLIENICSRVEALRIDTKK